MEIYDYTVEKEESGIRIDRILLRKTVRIFRRSYPSETSERRSRLPWERSAAKSNYKVTVKMIRIHSGDPGSRRRAGYRSGGYSAGYSLRG